MASSFTNSNNIIVRTFVLASSSWRAASAKLKAVTATTSFDRYAPCLNSGYANRGTPRKWSCAARATQLPNPWPTTTDASGFCGAQSASIAATTSAARSINVIPSVGPKVAPSRRTGPPCRVGEANGANDGDTVEGIARASGSARPLRSARATYHPAGPTRKDLPSRVVRDLTVIAQSQSLSSTSDCFYDD